MKTLRATIIRFAISIFAGLTTGFFLIFTLGVLLLAGQWIGYEFFDAPFGVNPSQGGLKSVVFELPLVVFGLPFLDAGCWPGLLAGASAHRLRSRRSILIAGCLGGAAFNGIVFFTYSLFDPVLAAGFILLEISAAFVASWIDAGVVSFFEKTTPMAVES